MLINPSRAGFSGHLFTSTNPETSTVVLDDNPRWIAEQSEAQWNSATLSRTFYKFWDVRHHDQREQLVQLLLSTTDDVDVESSELEWQLLQRELSKQAGDNSRIRHHDIRLTADEGNEQDTARNSTTDAEEKIVGRVAVLLVHIDNRRVTEDCLVSIRSTTYQDKAITVLDNASQNLSGVELFLLFPEATFLSSVARVSYTDSFNVLADLAIRHGADYLFISNNDTRSHSVNIFEELISAVTPQCSIVSPVVYDFDGNLLRNGEVNHFGVDFPIATEAYLVPVDVWKHLDGFTQSYGIYCEDVDLILRLRRSGSDGAYVTSVRLEHLQNATTGGKIFLRTFFYLRNVLWIQKVKRHRLVRNLAYFGAQEFLSVIRSLWRAARAGHVAHITLGPLYLLGGCIAGLLTSPRPNVRSQLSESLLRTTWEWKYRVR